MEALDPDSISDPLAEVRGKIDGDNHHLLDVLKERFEHVVELTEIKKREGIAAFQPDRFNSMVTGLMVEAEEQGLNPEMVREIMHVIHTYTLAQEQAALAPVNGGTSAAPTAH